MLTCRAHEYREMDERVSLTGAVELEPLSDRDIREYYLKNLPSVWDWLANDEELRHALRTPLLLSLFAFAYSHGTNEGEGLSGMSPVDLKDKIIGALVRYRYEREARKARPNTSLVEIYLVLGQAATYDVLTGVDVGLKIHHSQPLEVSISECRTDDVVMFLEDATRLNLLVRDVHGELRFLHLLLRDHFCIHFARQQLRSSDPHARASAAKALCKLDDEKSISYGENTHRCIPDAGKSMMDLCHA